MARPTKLAPEVEERIIKALLAGSHVATAARCAGLSPSTFHRWIERGDPTRTRAADRPYRKFRARVEQTLAEAEVRQLVLIDRAGKTHWRARAWLLERRHPERWGRRAASRPDETPARSGVEQSKSSRPAMAVTGLSDEQLDALAAAVGLGKPRQPPHDFRDEEHDTWLALARQVWHELYRRRVPIGGEAQRELVTAELEAIRQAIEDGSQGNPLDDPELEALRAKAAAQYGLPPQPR